MTDERLNELDAVCAAMLVARTKDENVAATYELMRVVNNFFVEFLTEIVIDEHEGEPQ